MQSERINLMVPIWLKIAMMEIAKSKGISMSEYIKDTMKSSVEKENKTKTDAN